MRSPGFATELAELLARLTHNDAVALAPNPVSPESEKPQTVTRNKAPARPKSKTRFQEWAKAKRAEKAAAQVQNWQHIRRSILSRDDYICRICGADPCEAQMHVHHVDWDRSNNKPRNLVTLCRDCHKSIHQHAYRPDGDDVEPWGHRGE